MAVRHHKKGTAMTKLLPPIVGLTTILWLAGLSVATGAAQAQETQAPIAITLVASKASYLEKEPIKLEIRVANISDADVITRKGFFNQAFHLKLTFIDPDGEVVRFFSLAGGAEGGPPLCVRGQCTAVQAEVIPPPPRGEKVTIIDDAKGNYDLTKLGHYRAFVSVPLNTFAGATKDAATGEQFAFLDGPGRQLFDPLRSNSISFDIVPREPIARSAIKVSANKLVVGRGPKPEAIKKIPLEGLPVRLFKRSSVPDDFKPIDYKTFPLVWQYVPPIARTLTNAQGFGSFERAPRDDYVVIAEHRGAEDLIYIGAPIGADDPDWPTADPISAHLAVIEKADKTQVAGRTTRVTGSELLITAPGYVLWDNTEELYPFVFESIGKWSVTTTVSPPEGFVADHATLSTGVSTARTAVQFTIAETGSRWEETDVTYKVDYKGKSKVIMHKIGIRLSKKLAQEKGLGIYGHTESPGVFEGGKKVVNK